jgi:ABC-type transporter Mla maintaining outer membrane lipid asymmetry ATPase subunit MlaF
MVNALEFENVWTSELLRGVHLAIPAGTLAAVITEQQEESDLFVRLLLGLAHPLTGAVSVLGEKVGDLPPSALLELRTRVAVVYPTGGLISNLKVWENLTLPLAYHSGDSPSVIEERGEAMLRRVGYGGSLLELPGHLTTYQKRSIGIARAMLMEPRLIAYNSVLSGLNETEERAIIDVALAFHREGEGRTSLFVTSEPESLAAVRFDTQIRLKGGVAHE